MKSKTLTSPVLPIIIFSDGACSGNPGPGGWGAIIATPEGEVRELGGKLSPTTNNQMELRGSIEGLRAVADLLGPVAMYTDSTYVIRGITQWIWGWRKRDWKTAEGKDVSNVELWKELSRMVSGRGKENPISWHYVRGHVGTPGNERVDEIAVAFSQGRRPTLYSGTLLRYDVAIHDLPEDTDLPEQRPREAKVAALSYLSLIGNDLVRHSSWADCERRVKGRSGAKFKKALNVTDEEKIAESWGMSKKDIKDSK